MTIWSKLWKYLVFIAAVCFLGFACNLPGSSIGDGVKLPTRLPLASVPSGTPLPFIEVTAPVHNQEKIILMSTLPDDAKHLSEVKFLLPDNLVQSEIFANDVKVEGSMDDEKTILINLRGKVDAEIVAFSFRSGSQEKAICVIYVDDLLRPQGDCTW